MTVKLTQEEKETIITFNEGEPTVNVFTYNQRWQHRMREIGIKPIRTEGRAREYEFPKKWLRLPAKPPRLTVAERERRRKSLKLARLASNITGFQASNKREQGNTPPINRKGISAS